MNVENGKLQLWKGDVNFATKDWAPTEFDHVSVRHVKKSNPSIYEVTSHSQQGEVHSTLKIKVTMNAAEDSPVSVETTLDQKDKNQAEGVKSKSHLDEKCEGTDLVLEQPLAERNGDALRQLARESEIYFYGEAHFSPSYGEEFIQAGHFGPMLQDDLPYCTLSASVLSKDPARSGGLSRALIFEDTLTVNSLEISESLFGGEPQTHVNFVLGGTGSLVASSSAELKCTFHKSLTDVSASDVNAIISPIFRLGIPATVVAPVHHDTSFDIWREKIDGDKLTSKVTITQDLTLKAGDAVRFQDGKRMDPLQDYPVQGSYCVFMGSDKTDVKVTAGTTLSLSSADRVIQNGDPYLTGKASLKDPEAEKLEYMIFLSTPGVSILCDEFDLKQELSLIDLEKITGGLIQFQ
jgi:hypothetical protein